VYVFVFVFVCVCVCASSPMYMHICLGVCVCVCTPVFSSAGEGYMSYEEEDTCLCVNIFERIRAKKLTQVSRLFNRRVPFGSDGCNCVGSLFRGALV